MKRYFKKLDNHSSYQYNWNDDVKYVYCDFAGDESFYEVASKREKVISYIDTFE